MKTEWIALFKNDLTSQVFTNPLASESVLYWIKRYENGKRSPFTYSGNSKSLRSFEIFDGNLEPSSLLWCISKGWSCISIEETGYTEQTSRCLCTINDPLGISRIITMDGFFVREGGNIGYTQGLDENLYFSVIVKFLSDFHGLLSWDDMKVRKPDLYKESSSSIPQRIYRYMDERKIILSKVFMSI